MMAYHPGAHFEQRVTMVVECAACPDPAPRRTMIDNCLVRPGECLPYPTLPRGWRIVDGNPICDLHDITLTLTEEAPAPATDEPRGLNP